MITLINGAIQSAGGVANGNGSITLQLTADAVAGGPPSQVVSAVPIAFRFDATGNLLGKCQIFSNAELSPQTQYLVNFFDQNGARLTNPILWQFTQPAGSTVDIGTMVPVQGGPSLTYMLGQLVVPFSATPVFNAAAASGFVITLTGNVTSSTLTGGVASQIVTFKIIQDATGGRTLAWPANVKNPQSPDPGANAISVQSFYFDGTNWYPIGPATVN